MKIFYLVILGLFLSAKSAAAQYSAQNEAKYIATLKAVVDYKINDEENYADIESLRENRRFNQDLTKMLAKLSNRRTKIPPIPECIRFCSKLAKMSIMSLINHKLTPAD